MWFVQSVIAYLLCASPCPLLLWGVFTGRICYFYISMRWNLSIYGPIATDKMQVGDLAEKREGRVDGAARTRPNQSGCETKQTRVHLERCDSTRSHSMRGKNDFGSHCLSPPPLLPTPPQVLIPFNVQLLNRHKQPSIVHARFCFAHPTGFILDSWNRCGFCCLSFIFMAIQSLVFYIQILAYRLKKYTFDGIFG